MKINSILLFVGMGLFASCNTSSNKSISEKLDQLPKEENILPNKDNSSLQIPRIQ